jgi:hypothetical protein
MDADHENWAIACTLLTKHGNDTPLHIAARMGELAMVEDVDGIQRWKEIARCVEQLMRRGIAQ